MIVVKLQGGLGNQLFQYALGRKMAYINNDQFKLDVSFYKGQTDRKYCLGHYNIYESFATKDEIVNLKKEFRNSFLGKIEKKIYKLLAKNNSYVREGQFNFDEKIINLSGNLYLEGYWQTEKYFKDIKDVIKKEFTLKNQSNEANVCMAEKINSCNSICLHVRRGDYVSNKNTNDFHGVCSLEYYYKAAEIITNSTKEPTFFVFSDDLLWVKENLKLEHPMVFVDINNDDTNYEDLNLMSLCKHNIIANSSFSWWGAWLGKNSDKIVIAPKKWFNVELSNSDVIPNEWIRL